MRYGTWLVAAAALLAALTLPGVRPAYAAFHCMRIHAVMHEFAGDPDIQFVELRMNTAGQNLLSGHTIQFYDASNTLQATFTFPAGSDLIITNASQGESILIGTADFNTLTTGGDADFVFASHTTGSDTVTPVQGPGGKVYFAQGDDNCDGDFAATAGEVDSVAYGAATSDWVAAAVALPSPGTIQALRMKAGFLANPPNTEATNNSTEYELANVAISSTSVSAGNLVTDLSAPRNNDRVVLGMKDPSIGGVAAQPDVDSLPAQTADEDGGGAVYVYGGAAVAAATVLALGLGGLALEAAQSLNG